MLHILIDGGGQSGHWDMSALAQWSTVDAAAGTTTETDLNDMDLHIQQTNERLQCIQQVITYSPHVCIISLQLHCHLGADGEMDL